jgi:hypothetical protein
MFKRTQSGETAVLRCSFCSKSQDDVRKLIAGVSANICDECVDVCSDIMHDDDGRFAAPPQVQEGAYAKDVPQVGLTGPAVRCALCRMPTPVEDGLLIANRGVLCPGCIGEIEAAVAESRQSEG